MVPRSQRVDVVGVGRRSRPRDHGVVDPSPMLSRIASARRRVAPLGRTSRTTLVQPSTSAEIGHADADGPNEKLVADIRRLIEEAKQHAATAVNAGLTLLYWRIGERIRRDILGGEQASYGDQVVAALAFRPAA